MKRIWLAAAGFSLIVGPIAASGQTSQPDWRTDHRSEPRTAPARPETRPAPRTYQAPRENVQPRGGVNANQNRGYNPAWRGATPGQSGARPAWNGERGNGGASAYERRGVTGQAPAYRNGGQYERNGYNRGYQGGSRGGARSTRLQGDWWRGRSGFSGYYGRRNGYWFAPGRGYYRVDPRWLDFDWTVGAVVPYELRSYYLSDPYDYGLPPAPYGCAWIFLGDQIVLIDMSSGEIVDIAGAY